jgi:hypothetical protein
MQKNYQRRSLRDVAEMVRQKGTEGDTILAHINPQEAALLGKNFGGSINPMTGLPEYGFLSKVFKTVRRALPYVGAAVGTFFGGPAGGAVGGSIGGALSGKKGPDGKRQTGKNALNGALISLPISFGMHHMGVGSTANSGRSWLGNMMNPFGGGGAGPMSAGGGGGGMMGGLSSFMQNSFGGVGGNSSQGGMPGSVEALEDRSGYGQPSMLQSLMNDPLKTALLATSIGGALGRRERVPQDTGPSMHDVIRQSQQNQGGPARRAKPLRRRGVHTPEGHRPGIDPEHIFFDEVNPDTEYYAHGGYVHDREGGQADNVPMKLRPKSYIMDATTVSLVGDGNSANGGKKFKELEDSFMRGGITRSESPSQHINAYVSGGEYRIEPETVTAIGKGNNELGAKKLDRMRKQLRKEKGLNKFLPPKTKKLANYIR